MSGPDVEGVLAGLVDTALRVESQHDPGCPGDERYCELHCPVPVQVEVPLAHVAAAVREQIAAWLADFPWTETARDDLLAALAAQVAPSRVPGEES